MAEWNHEIPTPTQSRWRDVIQYALTGSAVVASLEPTQTRIRGANCREEHCDLYGSISTFDKRFCTEKWRVEHQVQHVIFDVQAAANYLSCSKSHLSNILNGKVPNVPPIPHVSAGRKKLIRQAAIDEWIKSQEAASLEGTPRC